MHIEMWPEPVIELNKELATGYHPELETLLQTMPDQTFAERIAVICTHCKIAVDGLYTSDQIIDMIDHAIIPRLRDRRVNPNGTIIIGEG